MIISKPKASALFSLIVFLIIVFSLFGLAFYKIQFGQYHWGWMVTLYSSGPIGIVVLIRTLTGIKIFEIGKGNFRIRHPFRLKNIAFKTDDIQSWEHDKIKTYGGMYEELRWTLKNGKRYSISKQENTEFDKVIRYMKSKHPKLLHITASK